MRLLKWTLLLLLLWPDISQACQQFRNNLQDTNGNALEAGEVRVYKAGTSVLAVTYTDHLCTIEGPSPILTTADGLYTFWAKDGLYDIVFTVTNRTVPAVSRIGLFQHLLEGFSPVARYGNGDICATLTGAIDQIGSDVVTLIINSPVTCNTSKTILETTSLLIVGNGSITEGGGALLTINGPVVTPSRQLTLTYDPSIDADALNGQSFLITATNSTAFTIVNPTLPSKGRRITYTIKNSSGGVLGALTFGSAFKLITAWTQPADTKEKTIEFLYNGVNWVEVSRTADCCL